MFFCSSDVRNEYFQEYHSFEFVYTFMWGGAGWLGLIYPEITF